MTRRTRFVTGVAVAMGTLSLCAPVATATAISGAGGCTVLPANNVWHTKITTLPVAPNSAQLVATIGATGSLHPDFGSGLWNGAPIGIPYTVVPKAQPTVRVTFDYVSESDKGPYPIPAHPLIEGGASSTGDRHVLVVNAGTCTDYELYDAHPVPHSTAWTAGSGAVFALSSNALRPKGWTSADAAGLSILAGLIRPEEISAGVIDHAIRITVHASSQNYRWPARHEAGVANDALPPMGLRLRLKASVNIAAFPKVDQIILTALKTYGAIVADNGSPWFISGVPSALWNNDDLHQLTQIKGSSFEVVDESCLMVSPNSAQANLAHCPTH